MVKCVRQRVSVDQVRWLYAFAGAIVVALWLVLGQGVAAASPADADGSEAAGPESSQARDTSEVNEPASASTAAGTEDEPEQAASSADDAESDPEQGAGTPEVATADGADEPTEVIDAADVADVADDAARADTPASDAEERAAPAAPRSRSSSTDEEPAGDRAVSTARRAETDPVTPVITGTETRAEVPEVAAAMPAPPAVATTTLAAPKLAPNAPTLPSVVSARPVTVRGIVADLLTWVGLRSLADGAPAAPATPVSSMVEALWLVVRQNQYTFNNQRPTAAATTSGPGPDGVVTGDLRAVDYDDAVLAYTVTAGPQRGSVAIDALGRFSYTPDAGTPLRGDRFTVAIDDTVGNPWHIHGLLGLLGVTGPTEVTIVVAAPTSPRPPVDLGDLLSRDGVTVTTDDGGAAKVIDGRFTDRVVTGTADAASVLNALAPALGAAAGFADPSAIVAAEAGTGSSAEHFYRLTESIGGITVLGSDVILVTDADGAVTGLFNNYRGLGSGFDVTPASAVDENSEVRLIAVTACLDAGAAGTVESLLARSTFTDQLVVYALDDDADPTLAWRVIVALPDTGDMSQSGATYLIDADGDDAGAVIVTTSNVRDVTSVGVAGDWLGQQRTITFDTGGGGFFTRYTLVDAPRRITTYKTVYGLFGYGSPVLPGVVVKRGWSGWDRSAISAHANTAAVYDYYRDMLGRTSFDGAGAVIAVSIRYNPRTSSAGYANAFWDPSRQQFAFGDSGYLQAGLDVVGHEFTHAVVSYVVGDGGSVLDYAESGALNEAIADILGVLIEGKSGTERWLLGEDSAIGTVRNLANPTSIRTSQGPYRATYATRYTGSGDNGGEHVNSTIFSNAAYRMMTAAATTGVSDEVWGKVFYQSLFRLSPGAVFTDGRAAVLSTATALGFTAGQLDAVRDAFDAVGIAGAASLSAIAA